MHSTRLLAVAALRCAAATAANAQIVITTNNTPPAPSRSLIDGRRLVFNMNFSVNMPSPQINTTADVTGAMTTASSALYEVLNRQCDVLTASFKGTCRLVQMNVGGNIGSRAPGGAPNVTASATGTFEVEAEAPSQAPPAQR